MQGVSETRPAGGEEFLRMFFASSGNNVFNRFRGLLETNNVGCN